MADRPCQATGPADAMSKPGMALSRAAPTIREKKLKPPRPARQPCRRPSWGISLALTCGFSLPDEVMASGQGPFPRSCRGPAPFIYSPTQARSERSHFLCDLVWTRPECNQRPPTEAAEIETEDGGCPQTVDGAVDNHRGGVMKLDTGFGFDRA